jgi:hypothetical protein
LQVAASADDALELGNGTVSITSDIGVLDAANEYGGLRWAAAVPNAATINSATVSVVPSAGSDEPLHNLDFEAADDAAEFTTDTNNISSRTLTGNPVLWDDVDLGADSATFFPAPDVSVPLQAVIDRVGWSSGNNVVGVIRQPITQSTRDLLAIAYDTDPAKAAQLDIDYTAGGGGPTGSPWYQYASA